MGMDKLVNIDIDSEEFILEDDNVAMTNERVEADILSNQSGESLAQKEAEEIIPRCEFLTGGAGTGKTYEINRRMDQYREEHPHIERQYGVLAATTGIAAINMGGTTTTVNSVLKYFDTTSLEDNYTSGKLQQALKEISRVADNLVIDEISMMHAKQLDIIWDALVEINQHEETKERGGLGIIITGDFCQLPPVPEKDINTGKSIEPKYAFEAQCWPHFERNTTKLTKNWRQGDQEFVSALNYARKGDGEKAVAILRAHKGVRFSNEIETNFEGTTIFSKNAEVDRLNQTRLRNLLHGGRKLFTVKSFRWGKQRGEWKNIPEQLEVCESCYVMILANDSKQNGFRFANGTTGHVVSYEPSQEENKRDEFSPFPSAIATTFPQNITDTIASYDPDLEGLVVDFDEVENANRYEDMPRVTEDVPDIITDEPRTPATFLIKLKANGMEVEIGKICRQVLEKKHPDGQTEKPTYDSLKEWKENNPGEFRTAKEAKYKYEMIYLVKKTNEGMKSSHQLIDNDHCSCWWKPQSKETIYTDFQEHKRKASPEVYFDYSEGRWVTGEIYYFPLRIAYASTCHKSQGLTLDMVQIDFINQFFGSASMAYVALSRVRTAEGLRLVGSPKLLEERINVSKKVLRFI